MTVPVAPYSHQHLLHINLKILTIGGGCVLALHFGFNVYFHDA